MIYKGDKELLVKALETNFPNTTFKVTATTRCAVDVLEITWTDGPSVVEMFAINSTVTSNIIATREYSDDIFIEKARNIAAIAGVPIQINARNVKLITIFGATLDALVRAELYSCSLE